MSYHTDLAEHDSVWNHPDLKLVAGSQAASLELPVLVYKERVAAATSDPRSN